MIGGVIMYTNIRDIPRKQVAYEYDGCWFCDECYSMNNFTTKAYMFGNRKLCYTCALSKIIKKEEN